MDAAMVLSELDNLETTAQRLKHDREQMQNWSHIRCDLIVKHLQGAFRCHCKQLELKMLTGRALYTFV